MTTEAITAIKAAKVSETLREYTEIDASEGANPEVVRAAFAACDTIDALISALTPTVEKVETPAQGTPSPSTQTEGVDIPRLPVGTSVTKVLGYPFPGTVVSTFHTLSGQERFVVEATGEAYRGMLHIFNGDQLRATTEGQPDAS